MANIDKELNQIKNAVYGREVRGSIHDGIDKINKETEIATGKADEAHDVMESIINDGFDNAALESNFEQKLDDKINNLQPEWTQFKEQTNQQLAEDAEKLDIRKYTNRISAIASFAFDDGSMADYTRFKPIFESEGVPGCAAIITERTEPGYVSPTGGTYMGEKELKELKELGWTVASHTHTHSNLTELTDSQLDFELRESSRILKEWGLDYDIFVYPYGAYNDRVIKKVREFYQYAVDIDRYRSNLPGSINNMKISRVGGLSQPNRTLEQCKAEIDNALLTGEWVIFEDHAGYGFYQDPANLDLLRELIQYIKSKGVPIVNIRDGAMMKANIIEVEGNTDHTILSRDGKLSMSASYQMERSTGIKIDTPITEYENNVTDMPITNNQATEEGFPEGLGGTLITHRQRYDNTDSFGYQIYHIYSSARTYKREWRNDRWNEFERIDSIWRITKDNQYSISTPITDFPNNQVTVTNITSPEAAEGSPTGYGGLLETYRLGGTRGNYQVFRGGSRTHTRRWLSTNEFEEFVVMGEMLPMYTEDDIPEANSANRGRQILVYYGTSQDDKIMVCMRKADGTFSWRTLNVT